MATNDFGAFDVPWAPRRREQQRQREPYHSGGKPTLALGPAELSLQQVVVCSTAAVFSPLERGKTVTSHVSPWQRMEHAPFFRNFTLVVGLDPSSPLVARSTKGCNLCQPQDLDRGFCCVD